MRLPEPLHRAWHWFVTDDMRLRRWFRGFLSWLVAAAIQVTAVGADTVMAWPLKRWVIGFAIAGLAGLAGLINLGEKNPQPTATPEVKP